MSAFLERIRVELEPGLVCRCGVRNRPGVRVIRIVDVHGQTACAICQHTGPVQDFQEDRR